MELKDIKFDSARFDNHLIENRQVRIFLSSTFSDMQEERTELVKVFEILKVEAAERNVSLSVVDLRWGVTKKEAKSGKVISVCLEEIEHSHPFFIGILGSNYGTAPKREEIKKNPELLERYKWLDKAISDDENGMSITEMEIQYGVLKNNKKDIDAAFYFRKSDEPDNNKRLTKLKNDIRDYCCSKGRDDLPKDFSEVSELCNYVMEEVRNVINKHFPETKEVTLLDRERSAQKAYINSRHSIYHERKSYYDIIDEFVYDDSRQHLVFTGASGIGKSALLANWILKNEKNTNFNLIYHFVGNSFSGNNYESILRHICDEIYGLYDILRDDNQNEKIEEVAQRLVAEVYRKDKQLIIVIDGINQIETRGPGKEKLLLWLPSANKNVKYIFSTLPGDETKETFNRRKYKVEKIEHLSDTDLKKWIPRYLKRVGKSLDKDKKQLGRVVKWALSNVIMGNMLALRTLLDELTRFGVYEKVDERIDYYTSASSIPDFFDRVLSCLEKDYSPEKDLVKHVLMLIAASEHGLSEDELMSILGCKEHPLQWKLFFCAFYNHFVVKNGLITFSHQYVVEAIKNRYHIEDIDNAAPYRHEIVKYFTSIENKNAYDIKRKTEELAYQYYNLSDLNNLYSILLYVENFECLFNRNPQLLAQYWRLLLNSKESYPLIPFVLKESNVPYEQLGLSYSHIATFLDTYFTDYPTALEFNLLSLEIRKIMYGTNHYDVAISYNNVGLVYLHMAYAAAWTPEGRCVSSTLINDLCKKSLEYAKQALQIRKKVFGNNHPDTAMSYCNIGAVYDCLDLYSEALFCYESAMKIEKATLGDNHQFTASSINNVGMTQWNLYKSGKHNEPFDSVKKRVLDFLLESLNIRIDILGMSHEETAMSYHNIGTVYADCMQYNEAIYYLQKALQIKERILGSDHRSTQNTKLWIKEVNNRMR